MAFIIFMFRFKFLKLFYYYYCRFKSVCDFLIDCAFVLELDMVPSFLFTFHRFFAQKIINPSVLVLIL